MIADALVPDTGFQVAPAIHATVTQTGHAGFAVGEVQPLGGQPLEGHTFPADLGFQHVRAGRPGSRQLVMLGAEAAGADFIGTQYRVAVTAGPGGLEVAARTDILRAGPAALVAQAERVGGIVGPVQKIDALAIGTVVGAPVATGQRITGAIGKARTGGFDDDATADAVTAHTDRSHTGPGVEPAHALRVQMGQDRVQCPHGHAGHILVIDHQPQAVSPQAPDERQRRQAARPLQVHFRQVGQQAGTIGRVEVATQEAVDGVGLGHASHAIAYRVHRRNFIQAHAAQVLHRRQGARRPQRHRYGIDPRQRPLPGKIPRVLAIMKFPPVGEIVVTAGARQDGNACSSLRPGHEFPSAAGIRPILGVCPGRRHHGADGGCQQAELHVSVHGISPCNAIVGGALRPRARITNPFVTAHPYHGIP